MLMETVFSFVLQISSSHKNKNWFIGEMHQQKTKNLKVARLMDMACKYLQAPSSDYQIIACGRGIEFNKMT